MDCEPSGCAENINGSNCSTCGDYVCDTPADPCLLGKVDAFCQYIGGGGYTPLVDNYMSYSGLCRTDFTNGQANRVRAALAVSSVLEPVIRPDCVIPDISGPDVLCNPAVYTLNNLPSGATVVWSASPAGRVTFSNQTTNTITAQNVYNQHGTAMLRAEISVSGNTISVFKTVTLPMDVPHIALNPPALACLTKNSNRTFQAGYTTTGPFQHIDTHLSVTEVEWQVHNYSTSPPLADYQLPIA